MPDFVHLHNHTEYSLLDGLSQIKPLVEKTKGLGMDALAITDHGVMYGVIKFYNACKAAGIKPIIGCEIYMAHRSRFDKQPKVDADQYHLVLLAKNFEGYQNLMKIVTKAHLEGFYYKPRADMELLKKYSEGLIALTACIEGEVPSLILQNNYQGAKKKTEQLLDIFGDDFYLEIQNHPGLGKQDKANKGIIKLSRELGIPLVATNDDHYINKEDAEAQDALLALQTQKTINDPNRLSMIDCPDFYLKSPQEMAEQFADQPDAVKNTIEIADKCNLEIPIAQPVYPNYPIPAEETAASYLRKLTYERLPDRYDEITEEIKERVDYELDLIIKLGYPEYFLIVQDFVNWAKGQGIRVGPGRGSVAGSVIAYALRITSVDSLKHDLPFERFLNIERESTPDIDLDFPDDRRDEVINYVKEKYGQDRVAHIITFGSMEARMAVRDVARVLDHPYSTGDRLAKLIPQGDSIDQAMENRTEFKQAYNNNPDVKKILDLAKKFTGLSRHASTHAAGVVITDDPLVNYTPLQRESNGDRITTQYDMYSLDLNIREDALGLLKVDFLGLRNLTIIEKSKDYIKATTGKEIDLSEIPLDDEKVYQMVTRGDTTGLFQMESQGMRRVANKLKPTKFSDLSAMIALYRPGPMEWIDEFIASKEDPAKIHYPHEDLKPVLEETYGIAVYQEQVMKMANVMADYALGEGDILRRAIGKKKMKIMKEEEKRFKMRAKKKGYSEEVINNVWEMIKRFAGYGFNKAHTVSYAKIAYENGWLKANYPVQFMAALMTAEASNENKLALAVDECRRMGIILLPPDINESDLSFTIKKNSQSKDGMAIRCGFSAIKNVGQAAIEEILRVREDGGEFSSLTDFCLRVNARKVNKTVVESLIKSGAMDQFGSRKAMLEGLESIRDRAKKKQKAKANGQVNLFHGGKKEEKITNDNLPSIDNFTQEELLDFEKELLGIYISEHPLQNELKEIEDLVSHKTHEVEELKSGKIQVAGRIKNLRIVTTRNGGKEMAFTSIEDETGTLDIVVFPSTFKQNRKLLSEDKIVYIEAKIGQRQGEQSVIAHQIKDISQVKGTKPKNKKITIKIPKGTSRFKLVKLNSLLKKNKGDQNGTLHFPNGKRVKIPFKINWTEKLKKKIEELLN